MKLMPGQSAPAISARTILGKAVTVPDPLARHVHLQFRRFAGCPVCNFHLLGMSKRHAEIAAAGIHQIVFFHSSAGGMLKYQAQLPFDCIADPGKGFYRKLGVETSAFALFNFGVFWSGLRWIVAARRSYKRAEGGILDLPADFLIGPQGRVLAAKYGVHADDHWDADELLRASSRVQTAVGR